MQNSRHSEAIVSPSLSRITNRIRSSITELSFHGILLSAPFGPKSVTHVSGTFCYLCLGTDRRPRPRTAKLCRGEDNHGCVAPLGQDASAGPVGCGPRLESASSRPDTTPTPVPED